MPITASEILEDRAQADGRRHVRERHTDHVGVHHTTDWSAGAGVDAAAAMVARVPSLEAVLARQEMRRNLAAIYQFGPTAVVTSIHIGLPEIRAALREAYRTATREQAMALGAFLSTLTNQQLGTLFGLSGAQLTNLRTRLQAKATQWADYVAAAGE